MKNSCDDNAYLNVIKTYKKFLFKYFSPGSLNENYQNVKA